MATRIEELEAELERWRKRVMLLENRARVAVEVLEGAHDICRRSSAEEKDPEHG